LAKDDPIAGAELSPDFRTVMGRAPVAVLVKNGDGFYIFANPAAEHLLGYGPGQLGGMHIGDISADDPLWLQAEFDRFKSQNVWNGNLLFRCKGGDLITTSLNAFVSNTLTGSRAYIAMLRRANTEQRQSRAPSAAGYDLNSADQRLLQLLSEGFQDRDIASILGLSDWAVAREVTILMQKMRVRSRTAACIAAIKARIIV
jgi:PAS domain S-box-containing protein